MSSQEYIDNAGQEPGLEIWRIEDAEMAPVPRDNYGTFYNGDSYVMLHSKELTSGNFDYNIHFWLGEKTEQTEAGCAALWTVQLDEGVAGGAAVQHREVQGNESKQMLSYFKKGLIYKEGGVASGFNHVIPNDYSEIQRLLWVRGKNPVRCTQVEMTWDSLNKSDCFILDLGNEIYVWCGPNSNPWERMSANEMGRSIRDDERAGKAEVFLIDAGEVQCPEKLVPYLGDLPDDIADEAPENAPSKGKGAHSGAGKLFKISDEDGDVSYSLVSDTPPYSQDMLEPDSCFILGTPQGPAAYVWKGKDSSAEERKQAVAYCEKYIEENDLPRHTQFEIMAQFGETAMFKQFFSDWRDKDETEGLGEENVFGQGIAKVEYEEFDASDMHENPEKAAEFGMPDNGQGEKQVFRIVDSEREEVAEENWGIFYSTECYLISYTYETPKGKPESYVYYWLGNSAGTAAETACAMQTRILDDELFSGDATQVRVEEGKEPSHLIAMFNGGFAVLQSGSYDEPAPRNALFQIRLNRANQIKVFEVGCSAENLNSNDTFLAVKEGESSYGFSGESFAWIGRGGDGKEKAALEKFAELIGANENIEEFKEGEESDDFWDLLGGEAEYFKLPKKGEKPRAPRCFECSSATGNFKAEEIMGILHQSDLNPSNVMLLDTWTTIFIWIGNDSSEDERENVQQAAKDYLASDPAGRKGTPIITVRQGKEPVTFTGFFAGWDDEFWDTDVNDKLEFNSL